MGCCCSAPLDPETFLETPDARFLTKRGVLDDALLAKGDGQDRAILFRDVAQEWAYDDTQRTVVDIDDGNGTLLFKLELQPSFGNVSVARAPGGKVVAALKTFQTVRPLSGFESTCFDIFSARALHGSDGRHQNPSFSVEGINMYPWARVKRFPFTNRTEISLANATEGFESPGRFVGMENMGFAPRQLTVKTNEDVPKGIALGKRSEEKPARHRLYLSSGMDGGLVVLWFFATQLLNAEIPESNH